MSHFSVLSSALRSRWGTLTILSWLVVLVGGLGNSLEPISILTWLHPVACLLLFGQLAPVDASWKRQAFGTTSFWLISALGSTLAFAGVFGYPSLTAGSIAATFGFSVVTWIPVTIIAFTGTAWFLHLYPTMLPHYMVFAVLNTAAASLVSLSTSSFSTFGNGTLDVGFIRSTAALLGLPGINFLISMTAAAVYSAVQARVDKSLQDFSDSSALDRVPLDGTADMENGGHAMQHPLLGTPPAQECQVTRWRAFVPMTILGLTALIGGGLQHGDSFWQKNIERNLMPHIQVSCVLGQDTLIGTEEIDALWRRTSARLTAGATHHNARSMVQLHRLL